MIGGSCPVSRQMDSIAIRVMAFAMCLKFQVTKYSIPWMAAREMWAASRGSVFGIAWPAMRAAANLSASAEALTNSRESITVSRSRAALSAPALHSSTTRRDTKSRYVLVAIGRQLRVAIRRPATTGSLSTRPTRCPMTVVSTYTVGFVMFYGRTVRTTRPGVDVAERCEPPRPIPARVPRGSWFFVDSVPHSNLKNDPLR